MNPAGTLTGSFLGVAGTVCIHATGAAIGAATGAAPAKTWQASLTCLLTQVRLEQVQAACDVMTHLLAQLQAHHVLVQKHNGFVLRVW